MTEKEAIEKLHNEKKIDLITLIRKFKKEGIENFIVTRQEIIETVLQSLEQKDKEISELKEKYDRDTHTLQNQLDVANTDRVEKDKIIDEMTKYIESKELLIDKQFNILTANCIKQYFEKKVSDGE